MIIYFNAILPYLMLQLSILMSGQKDIEYYGPKSDVKGDSISFLIHNNSRTDLFICIGAEMKFKTRNANVTDDIFTKSTSMAKRFIQIKPVATDTLVWSPKNILLLNPKTFQDESIQEGNLRLIFVYGESMNDRNKIFKTDFFKWRAK
jgi:hypothetical protein